MVCRLLSNSTVWEFWLTFCFSISADLGRHQGVGAPPSEKQKVLQNGASHGRSNHTNEESRRRSFQWCMNQAIWSLFRVFDPLSVARAGNVHRGHRRSRWVTAGSNGRSSRAKQIERCAADQWKEHEIPRLFVGFSARFRGVCVEKSACEVRRRVRAEGTTTDDRNTENDKTQLHQTGVPAREWRLYEKLRGRGVQRAALCALSCPFSVFLPVVESPLQRKAARRVAGFKHVPHAQKGGVFPDKTPTNRKSIARASRWCASRSYACSEHGERS